jgi:hypothetical protein
VVVLGALVDARRGVEDDDGEHVPGGGWIRLSTETLDALQSHKAREGHHSFDATVAELLGDA